MHPSGDVLLERRTTDGDGEHADRITAGGEVWRWSTITARIGRDGMEFERGPGTWRHLGDLDADGLAGVRGAIDGAGSVPDEIRPRESVIGGATERWVVDGRPTTVHGAPFAHPQIDALADALERALAIVEP